MLRPEAANIAPYMTRCAGQCTEYEAMRAVVIVDGEEKRASSAFGRRLRQARLRRNLSQEDMVSKRDLETIEAMALRLRR